MPQVPVYGEQRVQETALPDVRIGANATVDAFGGGRSADALSDATQGFEKEVSDIGQQEKSKADNLAALSFDNQLSQTQTQIQVNASKMLGRDALGAPDYVTKAWNDAITKVQSQASNDAQKMAIARAAAARYQELNRFTQIHVGDQMQKFADNETQSYIENSRTAAVQNAFDPDKVNAEIARTTAASYELLSRKGIPLDSEQAKTVLQSNLSNLNKSVTQALLDKDSPTNVQDAKAYVDSHKDQFTGQDLIAVQKAVDSAETAKISMDAYNSVKGMKLPTGEPDEARMQRAIFARSDISDQRKQEIWKFVDGMNKDAVRQKALNDQANDRTFMNTAIQARQQGASLQDALKLADRFGSDPYDTSLKQNAIRQIYAPPTKSDPTAYISLWERIQDGNAQKSEIDQAFNKQQINSEDWRKLREDFYKSNTEDTSAEDKQTWDRIKILAEENFSDKKKRDEFMYVMHSSSDGKSNEELWKIANDKLKTAPGTGIFGTDWFGQTQWKADYDKSDAQDKAWGKLYQDVGDSETKAIGQGLLYSGKKTWGLGDVDSFAAEFGGYDKIKGGTPVNNAIQSLMRRKQLATPANIKAVLSKYPDGKY